MSPRRWPLQALVLGLTFGGALAWAAAPASAAGARAGAAAPRRAAAPAAAQGAASPQARPAAVATALQGRVERLVNGVWAPVKLLDPLPVGTPLRTGPGAQLELSTVEGAMLRLGPNTGFTLGAAPLVGQAIEWQLLREGAVPGGQGVVAQAGSVVRLEGTPQGVQARLLDGAALDAGGAALRPNLALNLREQSLPSPAAPAAPPAVVLPELPPVVPLLPPAAQALPAGNGAWGGQPWGAPSTATDLGFPPRNDGPLPLPSGGTTTGAGGVTGGTTGGGTGAPTPPSAGLPTTPSLPGAIGGGSGAAGGAGAIDLLGPVGAAPDQTGAAEIILQ